MFDFKQFETIISFCDSIHIRKINIKEAEKKHTNLLENAVNVSNKSRPRSKKDKN